MKIWYDSEMDMYICETDMRCAYAVDVKRGFAGDFTYYLSILSHANGGPLYEIDDRIAQLRESIARFDPDEKNHGNTASDAESLTEELETAIRIRADFA